MTVNKSKGTKGRTSKVKRNTTGAPKVQVVERVLPKITEETPFYILMGYTAYEWSLRQAFEHHNVDMWEHACFEPFGFSMQAE